MQFEDLDYGITQTGAPGARGFIYLVCVLWLGACVGFEHRLAKAQAENMRQLTDTLGDKPCVRLNTSY